jgi:anti-sigma factor RsiW
MLFKYQTNQLPSEQQRKLKAHIESCEACRTEQAFLKLMALTFSDKGKLQIPAEGRECCDEETLSAYIDKTLTRSKRESVEAHLAQCDRCLSELVALYDIVESIKTEGIQPTPSWLLERAGVSRPQPHSQSWWQGLFRPFEPSGLRVATAVATICLLLAIGVGIFLLNRSSIHEQVQHSLVAVATVPELSSALKAALPIAEMPNVDDRFTRGATGTEIQLATRYFRLGVCSATMMLSLHSVDSTALVEYNAASLGYLEWEMQYLEFPTTLPQLVSRLRQDLTSGLYTPNEIIQRARQLDSEIAAYIHKKKPAFQEDFWFGKWTLAVSLYAKQALLTQAQPSVELRELLEAKWIEDFRGHLKTTEWDSRPIAPSFRAGLAALTELESLSQEINNPATLPKIEEEAQRILNAYLGEAK